jgi:hypothetical protein
MPNIAIFFMTEPPFFLMFAWKDKTLSASTARCKEKPRPHLNCQDYTFGHQ